MSQKSPLRTCDALEVACRLGSTHVAEFWLDFRTPLTGSIALACPSVMGVGLGERLCLGTFRLFRSRYKDFSPATTSRQRLPVEGCGWGQDLLSIRDCDSSAT